nr:MAG TPA: hypothetical protein [Caudoviricetes sp.]
MRHNAQPRAKNLLPRCGAFSYVSGGTKIQKY